jgi:hypothetical protein
MMIRFGSAAIVSGSTPFVAMLANDL